MKPSFNKNLKMGNCPATLTEHGYTLLLKKNYIGIRRKRDEMLTELTRKKSLWKAMYPFFREMAIIPILKWSHFFLLPLLLFQVNGTLMLEQSTVCFLAFSLGFQPNNKKKEKTFHTVVQRIGKNLTVVEFSLKKHINQKVRENWNEKKERSKKSERDQRKENIEKA